MNTKIKYIKISSKYLIGALILAAGLSSAVFGLDQDPEGYYQIKTGEDLFEFAQKVNGGETTIKGRLMNDITIDENVNLEDDDCELELKAVGTKEWTPIGTRDNPFNGEFISDQVKSINGLYINSDNDYVGLFGDVGYNGKINDVRLVNSYIKGRYGVGGIAGRNRGTIDGCSTGFVIVKGVYHVGGNVGLNYGTLNNILSSSINVEGKAYVGGNVGENHGTISGDRDHLTGTIIIGSDVKISGDRFVGGNVGSNDEGTISDDLINKGKISGKDYVGGNVGSNHKGQIIAELTNRGKVTGTSYVGGNIGHNVGGTISDMLINEGKISGNENVGGNVGGNVKISIEADKKTISGILINNGKISGQEAVGGNVGHNNMSQIAVEAKLENKGKISGKKEVGGNVGFNRGTISGDLSNEEEISGDSSVGGNVGLNKRQITAEANLTNTGKVIVGGEEIIENNNIGHD